MMRGWFLSCMRRSEGMLGNEAVLAADSEATKSALAVFEELSWIRSENFKLRS